MLKTAESVKRGHPDKVCDQISDAILDECLKQDEDARVAIEVAGGHGIIYVFGELTTSAYVDIPKIVKGVYKDIGYKDDIGVISNVVAQSPDIAMGIDNGGAGDQGIMVGYACRENEAMIPHEAFLARMVTEILEKEQSRYILPDGKAQVTLDNDELKTLVVSNQTSHFDYDLGMVVWEKIMPELEKHIKRSDDFKFFVNPTGRFVQGGFDADTGLTGRKLAVDNYGPQIPLGGGCFSGKDPSKVDRSGAYMARRIAVDILNENHSVNRVTVKLAYSIGISKPVMVTATNEINQPIEFDFSKYDLTPKGIIKVLDLKKPIYYKTAQHGHFGREFSWDKN